MKPFIFIFIASLFFIACQREPVIHKAEIQFGTMGTYGMVKIISDSLEIDETAVLLKIDSLLHDVNMGVSTYIDSSVIARSNQEGFWIEDGNEIHQSHFKENLTRSLEIMRVTNGQFNVFVKPLIDFWGFGDYDKRNLLAKDSLSVDSLLNCINSHDVYIRDTSGCMQLDFSAIAKGYGVDQVANLLERMNYERYMVEIGGEVVCKGKNADEVYWRLGIEEPNEESRSIFEVMQLENRAMATSGNYRNFKILDNGLKVVHIINPSSGYPEISNLLSASIIADNCMSADAYATACMVMGIDTCFDFLLNHPELEGYLIYSDEAGQLKVKQTKGFEEMIVE